MKTCPSCHRSFDDETLSFCPQDGSGLEREASSGSVPLQATMLATPSSLGGASYPPPPPSAGPGSGSFNPPPPNPSWAPSSAPNTSSSTKSGGINKKLIFGGLGCLGLVAILGIVGIAIFAFSGPSSKMNPYKADLKALAPENVGIYKRTDVEVLSDRDKEGLGAVNDAISVAYKNSTDVEIEMFVGNYTSAKDAEAGLESFKNKQIGRGFSTAESGSKKIGWRTVGTRFIMSKDTAVGKARDGNLPDGATFVLAQAATTETSKKVQLVGWTNGSVVIVMAGNESRAIYFEQAYDAAVK